MTKAAKWATLLGWVGDTTQRQKDYWVKCPCCNAEGTSLHIFTREDPENVIISCYACNANKKDVINSLWIVSEDEKGMTIEVEPAADPWQAAMEQAADAILGKIRVINGRLDTASDKLVDAIRDAFIEQATNRVTEVMMREADEALASEQEESEPMSSCFDCEHVRRRIQLCHDTWSCGLSGKSLTWREAAALCMGCDACKEFTPAIAREVRHE